MPEKPFIAARIPEDLNQALIQHVESSGLNRTEVIINALAEYLKLPTSFTQGNKNDSRLDLLEERILNLEKLMTVRSLPPNPAVNDEGLDLVKDNHENLDHEEPDILIKTQDERQERLEGTTLNLFTLNDNGFDNTDNKIRESNINSERLTHTEVSEITGVKYNTVKSRTSGGKNAEIKYDGKIYASVREGKKVHWIVKTADNTDNEDTLEF